MARHCLSSGSDLHFARIRLTDPTITNATIDGEVCVYGGFGYVAEAPGTSNWSKFANLSADYVVSNESELLDALSSCDHNDVIGIKGVIPLTNSFKFDKLGICFVGVTPNAALIRPKDASIIDFEEHKKPITGLILSNLTFRFYMGVYGNINGNTFDCITQDREFITNEWAGYKIYFADAYGKASFAATISSNTANTITINSWPSFDHVSVVPYYFIFPQTTHPYIKGDCGIISGYPDDHRLRFDGVIRDCVFRINNGEAIVISPPNNQGSAAIFNNVFYDLYFPSAISGKFDYTVVSNNMFLGTATNDISSFHPDSVIDFNGRFVHTNVVRGNIFANTGHVIVDAVIKYDDQIGTVSYIAVLSNEFKGFNLDSGYMIILDGGGSAHKCRVIANNFYHDNSNLTGFVRDHIGGTINGYIGNNYDAEA